MNIVGPKHPAEIKRLRFPFALELDTGTSLSALAASVTVAAGTDASPAALLLGLPTAVGTEVLQLIQGGLHGVEYQIDMQATDNTGLRHVRQCRLRITNQLG